MVVKKYYSVTISILWVLCLFLYGIRDSLRAVFWQAFDVSIPIKEISLVVILLCSLALIGLYLDREYSVWRRIPVGKFKWKDRSKDFFLASGIAALLGIVLIVDLKKAVSKLGGFTYLPPWFQWQFALIGLFCGIACIGLYRQRKEVNKNMVFTTILFVLYLLSALLLPRLIDKVFHNPSWKYITAISVLLGAGLAAFRLKGLNIRSITLILGICFLFILFLYIVFILVNPEWRIGDDRDFLITTGRGNNFPKGTGHGGRFYPIGHIWYYWLTWTPWYKDVFVYYIQNVLMLVLSLAFLHYATPEEKRKSLPGRMIIISFLIIIITLPNFSRMFSEIIFPEKATILFLSVFISFYLKGRRTGKIHYYIVALVANSIATYTKEPYFVIGLCIGTGQLLFDRKDMGNYKLLFNVALVLNAIIFLVLYYKLAYSPGPSYLDGRFSGDTVTLIRQLNSGTSSLLILPFFWASWRAWKVLFRNDRRLIEVDLLLAAGFAYSFCYVLLKLPSGRYQVPALVLIYFSLLLYALKVPEHNRKLGATAALLTTFILFQFYVSVSMLNQNLNNLKAQQHLRQATPFMFRYLSSWLGQGKDLTMMFEKQHKLFTAFPYYYMRLYTFFTKYWADRQNLESAPFIKENNDKVYLLSTEPENPITINDHRLLLVLGGLKDLTKLSYAPPTIYRLTSFYGFRLYSTKKWPEDIRKEAEGLLGGSIVYELQKNGTYQRR